MMRKLALLFLIFTICLVSVHGQDGRKFPNGIKADTLRTLDGETEVAVDLLISGTAALVDTVTYLKSDTVNWYTFELGNGNTGDSADFQVGAYLDAYYNDQDSIIFRTLHGASVGESGDEITVIGYYEDEFDGGDPSTFLSGTDLNVSEGDISVTSFESGIPQDVWWWLEISALPGNRPKYANITIGTSATVGTSSGGGGEAPTIYTDNFEAYSAGDLDGNGQWNQILGSINIADVSGDNQCTPDNSDARSYYYYDETVSADQWSEITVDAVITSRHVGVSVRGSTTVTTAYYWYGDDTQSFLRRIVDGGSNTTLATGGAFAATDVIRLEIAGDILSCYKNDALDTSIDTDGKYTDDSEDKLTSGNIGIMTYGTGVSYLDNWRGGPL